MEIAMNNTDPNRFPLKWFQPRPGWRRTCCRCNFFIFGESFLVDESGVDSIDLVDFWIYTYIYIYMLYTYIYIFQIDLYSQDITSIDNNLDFIESICKVPFWVTSDITIILPETHTQTLSNCQPAKHCSCKYLSNLSGFLRESWMLATQHFIILAGDPTPECEDVSTQCTVAIHPKAKQNSKWSNKFQRISHHSNSKTFRNHSPRSREGSRPHRGSGHRPLCTQIWQLRSNGSK